MLRPISQFKQFKSLRNEAGDGKHSIFKCAFRALIVTTSFFLSSNSFAAEESASQVDDKPLIKIKPLEKWVGDFDEMLKRRLIRVLVPFRKTYFFVDKGTEYGASAELGRELEKWINKRYKFGPLNFHVVFVPRAENELIPALTSGDGDLIAGAVADTEELHAIVDFPTPWVRDGQTVIVTGPNSPPLKSIEDLAGTTAYVRQSSSYVSDLSHLNERLAAGGLRPVKTAFIDENLEDEDILECVNVGLLTYGVAHKRLSDNWAKVLTKIVVRDDLVLRDNEKIGWVIRKNSPNLLDAVNEFIKEHAVGTGFGNAMLHKYFFETDMIKNAIGNGEIQKFTNLVEVFRKYGSLYDFDCLMMAAQGYQESQLDQSKRSPKGAVGVMQLLPATAAAKPIAITGIDKDADLNIKAGTLYMKLLRDQYVPESSVDSKNKWLMSLAAYDAGPGNLAAFREIAKDAGLSQDIWFNNVEYGASRKVGRQTVQYVSNIYKYYVAYKLVTERQQDQNSAMEKLEGRGSH